MVLSIGLATDAAIGDLLAAAGSSRTTTAAGSAISCFRIRRCSFSSAPQVRYGYSSATLFLARRGHGRKDLRHAERQHRVQLLVRGDDRLVLGVEREAAALAEDAI